MPVISPTGTARDPLCYQCHAVLLSCQSVFMAFGEGSSLLKDNALSFCVLYVLTVCALCVACPHSECASVCTLCAVCASVCALCAMSSQRVYVPVHVLCAVCLPSECVLEATGKKQGV